MEDHKKESKGLITHLLRFVFFITVFVILSIIGIIKAGIFSPFVFLIIAFGNVGVVLGLSPFHLVWSTYCITKTKRFGPCMKCILILILPLLIALWIIIGVLGSAIVGIGYGIPWPVRETFKAISKEGDSTRMKLCSCLTDGTWSIVRNACTIVRDFTDISYHSYLSLMNELLEWKGDKPTELKISQIPGCIICAIIGVLVDVPVITLIVVFKTPILLLKGWQRLLQDLIGREGPFLETVCVPFAGFLILLWPVVVVFASLGGILSSFFYGSYAAVIAYQESSIKRGMLYIVASISLFDESTNDFLSLPEGSCFPRPTYRTVTKSPVLPANELQNQPDAVNVQKNLMRMPSEKDKPLSAVLIWDNFFIACKHVGKELLKSGAIQLSDVQTWQHSKNKIIRNGIPAYTFLQCFQRSIKSGCPGFLMRDNVALTRLNRPEERVFDWLFEPMTVMKEQLQNLKLTETEELYLYKFCLYNGDKSRMDAWQNGGYPPEEEIRKAQLEGIGRRLNGYCLSLSRLPTYRRRYIEVVKDIEEDAKQRQYLYLC